MSNGSVGVISLDLIIKEKLGEQLEKIKSTVRSPAEKVGEQINRSVSKSVENVKKTFEKLSSVDPFSLQEQKAELIAEKISILTNKIKSMEEELQQCDKAFEFEENIDTIERLSKRYDRLSANINNARLQQVNLEKQLAGMSGIDLKRTQGQIFEEKIIDGFQEKISETSEIIKEKLGNFDVSSDPIERLQQELENSHEKMSLLQKKWQELSNADPSDKIISQLNAVERQIISTQSTIDKLEEKLYSDTVTLAEKIGKEAASFITAPFRGIKNTLSAIIKTPFFTALNAIKSGYAKLKYYLENPLLAVRDAGKKVFSALKTVGGKGLLDTAINMVQTINWRQIGSKIAEFIGNIDFSGIAQKFFTLLGSALGAGVSLIWGALENLVKSIGKYFSGKIEECGGNVALGLLKGIADGLLSIGKWIKDNIFKPFIDGFKKAFGIHSPSKEMAVMGGYIIDGLFNAISDGIAKIKEIFSKMLETIKKVFSKIDIWFKEKFSAAWNGIKEIFSGIGGWFSDRWNDIKRAFSTVGTWFVDIFQTAWNGIKIVFAKPGEFFDKVWEGIKSCFSHVTSWFRDTFSEAWQAVKDVFSRGGQIFVGIAESIADIFKDVVNHIIDGINWVIAQPFDAINDALDGIRNVKIFGGHPFDWLPTIDVPEIPRLAKGGLAAAPTLAMVGDNRNAAVDPEVIAPLSKLQGMLGSDNSEIVELLKVIIQLLRNGISAEIIGSIFGSDFKRAVLKICADDKSRRFG